ncbi:unnamed protein product [Adineta steineri]|uniref:CTP synthase (glutamine hydrolyzing) n=1 Tax=Adineta steineri TaxID=433720 RepID=A0A814FXB3_9BILA|nr:unnamed protein product [Adineta steineri]
MSSGNEKFDYDYFVIGGGSGGVRSSRIAGKLGARVALAEEKKLEFEKAGMKFVGKSDDNQRMEILELDNHPYFVGVQYHPEYISRPLKPSAPYLGLIWAACGELKNVLMHVTKEQMATTDSARKSSGTFSHKNLFRHT